METYVTGKIEFGKAAQGNINGVIKRLSPVGYKFTDSQGAYEFTKNGRIESVITEMVPVCEDHGLDVEDFQLIEYKKSDGKVRSIYEMGKIKRI